MYMYILGIYIPNTFTIKENVIYSVREKFLRPKGIYPGEIKACIEKRVHTHTHRLYYPVEYMYVCIYTKV